jgi:hypothetical protein
MLTDPWTFLADDRKDIFIMKTSTVFKEFLNLEDPGQCAENSEQLSRAEAGVVRGSRTQV